MKKDSYSKASILAIWISLISNIVLTILKLIVGFLFNSPVLIADGFHNAGDVIASDAALTSMRISKRPADEDHPYGHGKAEVMRSAIVAIILGLAALYIGFTQSPRYSMNLRKRAYWHCSPLSSHWCGSKFCISIRFDSANGPTVRA